MKKTPKALIIRTAGINCDIETKTAIEMAGAKADLVHTSEITGGKTKILNYDILLLPGGFSYGDDIAGGKIWAVHMNKVFGDIQKFIDSARPVMGICNGFQILTKLGFLPENKKHAQVASLTFNNCCKFIAQWEKIKINQNSPCIFTKNLGSEIELPIAHGEGKIIIDDEKVLKDMVKDNTIPLTYVNNPNGSVLDIAGVCNKKGNCFGLMPHPERFVTPLHHPAWTRSKGRQLKAAGLQIFKNIVDYI